MASLTSCEPIFTTSAIRKSKPKIPNQKHTNRAHILLIHIYIHRWPDTHKNSDTQTQTQTTINTQTRDTTKREIARGTECEREREPKHFHLTFLFLFSNILPSLKFSHIFSLAKHFLTCINC